MIYSIAKCDLCGLEKRTDQHSRDYSDIIARISLNLKGHAAIQQEWIPDVCQGCARLIASAIVATI